MVDLLNTVVRADNRLGFLARAVVFYLAGTYLFFPLLQHPFNRIGEALRITQWLSPGGIALGEIQNFLVALLCTIPFALYEHRRIDSYGLSIGRALSRETLEGFLVGVSMAGAVAIGMIVLGGMKIDGLALDGPALAAYAPGWLGACILVGIAEEFFFRSYLQQTLWKSIGFWPSAIVIALVFAAAHYFYKPGENIWDVITLVSLSMLLSYSMLRTGTLWFAVGWHIAFDYMQLFVIGTPNGSVIPEGRLLNARFEGPSWLTGGVLGTEASFLMYPAIALLWVYVWRRYRSRPPLVP